MGPLLGGNPVELQGLELAANVHKFTTDVFHVHALTINLWGLLHPKPNCLPK